MRGQRPSCVNDLTIESEGRQNLLDIFTSWRRGVVSHSKITQSSHRGIAALRKDTLRLGVGVSSGRERQSSLFTAV